MTGTPGDIAPPPSDIAPPPSDIAPPPPDSGYVPPSGDPGYVPPSEIPGYVPPSGDPGFVPPHEIPGYVPPGEVPPPPELSERAEAARNESRTAAAAAGLSEADWAMTEEGRAFADRQEAIDIASGEYVPGEAENDVDRGHRGEEPPGLSAEALADIAELEAAAAEAGLALEDYSDTPEGRARAEEMGRRAEERDIAAGLILPTPGNNVGQQASQSEIDGWQRGEDGSLMPPANWAVDGQGGYVFSPPEGEVPPPTQLSDRDLAEKNEFEAAAAEAGLTPEEFSNTDAGRDKGDEIARRNPANTTAAGLLPHEAAAAAGLSVADWAMTAEGRAHDAAVKADEEAQIAADRGRILALENPEGQSTFSDELLAELGLNQYEYNSSTGEYVGVDGDAPAPSPEAASARPLRPPPRRRHPRRRRRPQSRTTHSA